MTMPKKAWMTLMFFSHWISHCTRCLERKGGILHEWQYLLILNGHNFHVICRGSPLECREMELDLLTLPSHTSHKLQPWMWVFLHLSNATSRGIEMLGLSTIKGGELLDKH